MPPWLVSLSINFVRKPLLTTLAALGPEQVICYRVEEILGFLSYQFISVEIYSDLQFVQSSINNKTIM